MISVRNEGYVQIISLNDPSSFNSLSEGLTIALREALALAATADSVRAVVLTGEGKLFSAGGNLKDFMSVKGDKGDYVGGVMENLYNPLARQLSDYPVPLIVAMNGPAIGAGVGLAINADFVLAAEGAYFSLPFVPKLGIVPDMGSSWLLAQALGRKRAMALSLTGEKLSVGEAKFAGLVWQVCTPETVLTEAIALAVQLGGLAKNAIARTRELLNQAGSRSLSEHLDNERELQMQCFREPAFAEGLASFAEKRNPDFTRV